MSDLENQLKKIPSILSTNSEEEEDEVFISPQIRFILKNVFLYTVLVFSLCNISSNKNTEIYASIIVYVLYKVGKKHKTKSG